MTNGSMFVYVLGVVMKQGTANAWTKVHELSKDNEHVKKWFESPYVQTANQDQQLLKELDKHGL